jgi:hypothetical protein
VSFAQLIKVCRSPVQGEARYSPSEIASTEVVPVMGRPDPERICTSIVERQNLTMRMQIRRLTRLTNAFSKKWENLWAALCLLQPGPHPSEPESHAGHGSGYHGSCVGNRGIAGVTKTCVVTRKQTKISLIVQWDAIVSPGACASRACTVVDE